MDEAAGRYRRLLEAIRDDRLHLGAATMDGLPPDLEGVVQAWRHARRAVEARAGVREE